jgi:hypothetical protein
MQEAENRRTKIPGQCGKKVCKIQLQWKNLDVVEHTCHPSDSRKPKIGETWSRLAWAKSKMLSPK